jgi:hypothetical protein
VLHSIGRSVDKIHRIRANGNNRDGAMIGRKPHAVHQQLALIEWTEIGRQRVTKANRAEQLVIDRIRHRDCV